MKKLLLPLCMLLLLLSGCHRVEPESTESCTPSTVSETALPAQTQVSAAEPIDEDFYLVCTNLPKSQVETFAKEIRDLILARDWTALADRISFPITMGGTLYEDREAFLAAPFDTMLNADALSAIEKEDCTDMFCNYAGIMLANGEVWISEILREDFSSAGLWVISLQILQPAE